MEEKKYAYAYEEIYDPMENHCPFCDAEIEKDTVVCPKCGKQVQMLNTLKTPEKKEEVKEEPEEQGRKINKWVSLTLCFFLGFIGIHKYYEGRWIQGLLYFFTLGLFGIGWIVDIFIILFKPNPYYIKNKR